MSFLSTFGKAVLLTFTLLNYLKLIHSSAPLILTPLIEGGKLDKARSLARVSGPPFPLEVESYSGFLTVQEEHQSNLFFWFFPAEDPVSDNPPLLLWLNGGPGCSSQLGLFVENGPFIVNETHLLSRRTKTWTKRNSVLYIDSPVGTGYSFTGQETAGYASTMKEIVSDLHSALCQFFRLFPNLKESAFYLTGESFAGQYIPHLAVSLLEPTSKPESCLDLNLPLRGIAIGNGFIDPLHSLSYSDFLFQIGLFDEQTKRKAFLWEEKIRRLIREEKWLHAFKIYDSYIGYSGLEPNFISQQTGSSFYYNILSTRRPLEFDSYTVFLNQPEVKRTLHVGSSGNGFQNGSKVLMKLRPIILQSARTEMKLLLRQHPQLRILLFNGQLDIIVANRLTLNFLKTLNLSPEGEKRIWRASGVVSGYYKSWGNLTHLTVLNCGHMVPFDSPLRGEALISDWLSGAF